MFHLYLAIYRQHVLFIWYNAIISLTLFNNPGSAWISPALSHLLAFSPYNFFFHCIPLSHWHECTWYFIHFSQRNQFHAPNKPDRLLVVLFISPFHVSNSPKLCGFQECNPAPHTKSHINSSALKDTPTQVSSRIPLLWLVLEQCRDMKMRRRKKRAFQFSVVHSVCSNGIIQTESMALNRQDLRARPWNWFSIVSLYDPWCRLQCLHLIRRIWPWGLGGVWIVTAAQCISKKMHLFLFSDL